MIAWRGIIIQLACLAALVSIIHGSHDPNVLWAAIGIIGTTLGQTVARARVSGAQDGGNGNVSVTTTTTSGPGSVRLPPGIAGPLVTLAVVGGAYALLRVLS